MKLISISSQPDPAEFRVAKIAEDEQLVFGWASITKTANGQTVVDSQDEIIETEDLEPAVYEYVLNFADMGLDHVGEPVGKMVESLMLTSEKAAAMGISGAIPEGWWIGFHVPNPDVFAKFKSGEYGMFSIQGTAVPEEVES